MKQMITLKNLGYAWGETRNNPDGTPIYDGQEVYEAPNGVVADSYFLIQKADVQPGWNNNNPVVPDSGEHWFQSTT